jgi:MraZ protein
METLRTNQPIFAGEFRHTLDTKNRVTIPARWRRGDLDEFFAIPDHENGCLMVLPPEEFQRVAEKAESDPRVGSQERRKFIRQFYSRAQHVVSDKQGRIVVPEDYCRLLKLTGEVVLVGGHSRFEIWNQNAWRTAFDQDSATFTHVLGMIGL